MRKQYIPLFLAVVLCAHGCTTENDYYDDFSKDVIYGEDVCADMTDANFKEYCLENFDTNKDGVVSPDEAKEVIVINCSTAENFTGIECFPNLQVFISNSAKILDLTNNAELIYIMLSGAPIGQSDLSKNTKLETLYDSKSNKGAFQNCVALTYVVLPENSTSIGNYAFYGCTSLSNINDILEGVTSIGSYAFGYCTSLSSVTLPEEVTSIEKGTFNFCTNLSSIYIPAGVTSIGGYAFENCTSLTSISLPENLTEIGRVGFADCTNLSEIRIKASNPPTLGDWVFDGSDSLQILYVPSESVEAYKNSDWAQYFSTISPLEE